MDTEPNDVERAFRKFDADSNNFLTQSEFILLCCTFLWNMPLKTLKVAAEK